MEPIICGPSAFKYYRTPPQVLALCHELPTIRNRAAQTALPNNPTAQAVLGTTIHSLISTRSQHTGAVHMKQHLWEGPRPSDCEFEDPIVGTLTSPLFTLLTLSREYTATEVAMAMYELCGKFTVYAPSKELEALLPSPDDARKLGFGWQRVVDPRGMPSSLWMREPLVEIHELKDFAEDIKGVRGARTFSAAADMVLGVTRSPLEVKAAMLLGLPRTKGGFGFLLETDRVIRLDASARSIVGKDYLVADLYLESSDGTRALDIECQGAVVHSGLGAAISDADRACAIEAMGIGLLYLTENQLRSGHKLELFAELVGDKLGQKLQQRSDRMRRKENELRFHLSKGWEGLCGVS